MTLATIEEIEKLWDKYTVPKNVREHMKMVARVAVFIASRFKEKDIDVDIELIEKASLLHDLIRVCNFKTFDHKGYRTDPPSEQELAEWTKIKATYGSMHHAEAACQVLKQIYPELAEVIGKHRYSLIGTDLGPKTWEEKIVNYADKRVAHDKVVSVEERQNYTLWKEKRDKLTEEENQKLKRLKELENEIFSKLDIKPEDLQKLNEDVK